VPADWVSFYGFLPLTADFNEDTGVVKDSETGEYKEDAWTRDW